MNIAIRRTRAGRETQARKGDSFPSVQIAIGEQRKTKKVLLTSAKGGSGKTTTAYNLAAFAANDGLRVGIVDLDVRGALTNWWRMRPTEAPEIWHFHARMDDYGRALEEAENAELDLIIVDTPPAIEAFDGAIRLLVRRADICLVPSNQGGVDPSVATNWLKFLKREGARAACVLNRAKTNSRSFQPTKIELQSAGKLCPFEVRDLAACRT